LDGKSGFIEDRCFRVDGIIISAREKPIRTNGLFVRAGVGSAAAGQPLFCTDKHHPYKKAVSE